MALRMLALSGILEDCKQKERRRLIITNAIFLKKKKTCFQKILKEIWKFFAFRKSFTGKWIWQAGSVKILRFDLPS